jgi:hypothetical protein
MSDLVSMTKDMGLGDAIVYVADKIGISVQHMYEIMLHAQITIAIINILLLIVWCATIVVTVIVVYRKFVKPHEDTTYDSGMRWLTLSVITAIVALIVACVLTSLQSSLVTVFCPEYSALKELLYTFKNIL